MVEELLVDPRRTESTSHPKIFKALESGSDSSTMTRLLAQLEAALDKGALPAVYGILENLVEGYQRPDCAKDVLNRESSSYSFTGEEDTPPVKSAVAE